MKDSSINSFLCDGQQADRLIHASLFSGIGGFDLAAEWMNWINAFHCEWNEFGQKVLKYYWPNAISYGDITKTNFTIWRGKIDILTGGFPCQPYSLAGQRKGKEDERHLWPEMLRAIREIQPGYIVGENVYGLVNWNGGLVFHEVQTDLEAEGYEVQPIILPACAKNAPHRRDRVWFVAHSEGFSRLRNNKYGGEGKAQEIQRRGFNEPEPITNTECKQQQGQGRAEGQLHKEAFGNWETSWTNINGGWPTQPPVCIGNDGVPSKLDEITIRQWREESIKAAGNAIVPQVAYEIFKAIQIADRQKREEKIINTA